MRQSGAFIPWIKWNEAKYISRENNSIEQSIKKDFSCALQSSPKQYYWMYLFGRAVAIYPLHIFAQFVNRRVGELHFWGYTITTFNCISKVSWWNKRLLIGSSLDIIKCHVIMLTRIIIFKNSAQSFTISHESLTSEISQEICKSELWFIFMRMRIKVPKYRKKYIST